MICIKIYRETFQHPDTTSKDHAMVRDRCGHFQNGVTLKKKELIWRKVDEDVNTEDGIGHGHAAVQVKKRWKDMKRPS